MNNTIALTMQITGQDTSRTYYIRGDIDTAAIEREIVLKVYDLIDNTRASLVHVDHAVA